MQTPARAWIAGAVVWFVAFTAGGAEPSGAAADADALADVLRRFDAVQLSIRTLSAEFEETSTNMLLKEPVTSEGHFYLTKPDSVMWSYTTPERMQFVIADDEYLGYFPTRKQAERRDVQRWREQIFRFFGLGQASGELSKIYDIRLEAPAAELDGTYLLVLDPRKRKVKKRMDSVRFWVDRQTFLPVQVEYRDRSGNTRVVRFRDVRLNPNLAANHYRVEIPADVTVTTGFSGLQSLASSQ